jgi:hypothetical protein
MLTACSAVKGAEAAMSTKVDFCRDWTFVKSPAEWADDFVAEAKVMEPVTLPHTWNCDDMGCPPEKPHLALRMIRTAHSGPTFASKVGKFRG